MMDVFVRFWGTRGSIPTPGYRTQRYGGNTSCVELRLGDTLFVCDGGTGLRDLGDHLVARQAGPLSVHMLFSHTHWDHIQGFPFFVPAYSPHNTLYVYDVDPGDTRVHRLLSGQMRSEYFPVSFSDLGSRIVSRHLGGGERVIEGVAIRAFEQVHPGRSFAFSFEVDGRKIVYATDNEVDAVVKEPRAILANPAAPREAPADLVEFVRGSDLLIADGQYADRAYHEGFGHARATTITDLALAGGVRRLAVFHHDPTESDEMVDAKIADCRARIPNTRNPSAGNPNTGNPNTAAPGDPSFGAGETCGDLLVFAAREGLQIRLDPSGTA
jgi:phosphoribosyl 1,2-cyclic phosphodiesterase